MPETKSSRSPRAEHLVFLILFLTAAWFTAPELWRRMHTSHRALGGPFHESIENFQREIPEDASVALVMRTWRDVHSAIFANYYLYPRRVRIYSDLMHYRNDLSPSRPSIVLRVDPFTSEELRRMTYDEIRREEMGNARVIRDPRPASGPLFDFIVPLVAAVDGGPPDAYTTEAVLVSEVDATVTFTLGPLTPGASPRGRGEGGQRPGEGSIAKTKTVQLRANQPLKFVDVVWDNFGLTGSGWLRVQSTEPVRASFWFVNRGRRQAAPMRLFETAELPPLPQKIDGGEKLFVINADTHAKTIAVNDTTHHIPPLGFLQFPSSHYTEVFGEGRMLAFTTRKVGQGNTEFSWPR